MSELRLHAALRLQLAGLSPRRRAGLLRGLDSLEDLAQLGSGQLRRRGLPEAEVHALGRVGPREIEAERRRCERVGASLLLRGEAGWPDGLDALPDPPELLWVRGDLTRPARQVAVTLVGTRRPTPYGLAVTGRLARELAELGVVVVSGGARGLDGAAHDAALEAGGRTVVVLGCGVDVVYPPEHRALFERAVAAGAVVSELPCSARPLRHRFPARNRLLAAWSPVVVVPEAALRSGSLVTARLALEAGREVCAVPGPVTSGASEGTNDLIAAGAKLTRGVADVVSELPQPQRSRLVEAARVAASRAPPDPVLAALPEGRVAELDELARATGLGCGELLTRLVLHEAAGRVRSLPGGSWLGLVPPAPAPPDGRSGGARLASLPSEEA